MLLRDVTIDFVGADGQPQMWTVFVGENWLCKTTLLQTIAAAATGVDRHALPAKAAVDAVHIAIAAANGMDFLLTWNCKHIANASTRVSSRTSAAELASLHR